MESFDKKSPYTSREISWLDFNTRVLQESINPNNPVIERLKFIGMSAKNLDEFFMIRVASLQKKIHKKPKEKELSGLSYKKLYKILVRKIKKFLEKQRRYIEKDIIPSLKSENINFLTWDELNLEQKVFLENYFMQNVFPILTPIALDKGQPLPFLTNRCLYIFVKLISKKEKTLFAIVKIPQVLKRYIALPSNDDSKCFFLVEELIKSQIKSLFKIHKVDSSNIFRITRSSDYEIEEESDNIMQEVKNSIKKCKCSNIVRLELEHDASFKIEKKLKSALKVKEIYRISSVFDLSFYLKFINEEWPQHLKFSKIEQNETPTDFSNYRNTFDAIRNKDCLVCHPYDDFSIVTKFLTEAAFDENVLAIKQTLYRVSGDSPIINALISAADNGKQVTAFVELKARFDEENNIAWAQKLEKAGCNVIYGVPGLKTHCKIIMIIRKEEKIRRYIHLGTGNYNDKTAKAYTDMGLFTSDKKIGTDVAFLFNSLTGYSQKFNYRKLIVSPTGTRDFFKKMIKNEIKNAKSGLQSGIIIKVNSLVDKEIIDMLYSSSRAGVKVKLIVRGICCLVPKIPGISDNIKVISLVGKFLEHSRIFYFKNAGIPKVFLGSSDLMKRNLDKRIETIFPIENDNLKKRIIKMLKTMLDDNVNSYVKNSNQKYKKTFIKDNKIINCQLDFFNL